MTARPRRLILGCGFLGRPLARRWAEGGVEVFATSRDPRRLADLAALGVTVSPWEALSPGATPLPAVDAAVYAVGYDRTQAASMQSVYVDGLANALARLPPCKLVYVSSTGVYGDAGGAWIDETTPPQPTDPGGTACWEAEQRLRSLAPARQLSYIILRLAGIYGPGRMIGAENLRAGKPIAADPDGPINLIHLADAVAAVDAALERGQPGAVYNVADGQPVLRRDFYAVLADLLGAPPPTFDASGVRRLRGDRRVSNKRMLDELGVTLQFPDYRAGLRHCYAASETD